MYNKNAFSGGQLKFLQQIPLNVSDLLCVHLGLFVGKEGPMIHSGAIVGAGLPQVRWHTC